MCVQEIFLSHLELSKSLLCGVFWPAIMEPLTQRKSIRNSCPPREEPTMGESRPKRRWFRFSLRTLFILIALIACWLAYSVHWIKQRHAYLSEHPDTVLAPDPRDSIASAPGLLWL